MPKTMEETKTKNRTDAPDAAALLAQDHRNVEKIIEKFEKLGDGEGARKEELVRRACAELKLHAQIEEEIFYPALREKLKDEDLLDEAAVEHSVAKSLIAELEEMDVSDNLFDAKFKVLGEYVKHHVAEEEKEIFPKAKKAKLDLAAIGSELLKRKEQLQKRPH